MVFNQNYLKNNNDLKKKCRCGCRPSTLLLSTTLDCHAGSIVGSRPGRTRVGCGRAREAEGAQERLGETWEVSASASSWCQEVQVQRGGPEQEFCKETGLRVEVGHKDRGPQREAQKWDLQLSHGMGERGREQQSPRSLHLTPQLLPQGCLSPPESPLSKLAGSCQPSGGPENTGLRACASVAIRQEGGSPAWRHVCLHLPFLLPAPVPEVWSPQCHSALVVLVSFWKVYFAGFCSRC